MAKILIGTSGYSYKEWVGPFYPAGTDQRDYLRLYSQEFEVVELNFTYYHQPEAKVMAKMVESGPQGFLFTIKAYQGLTHEISNDLRKEAEAFKQGLVPLVKAGKLGSILAQFPYSFHYTPEHRGYLTRLCAEFEGLPLAIEFRNQEWLKESVYEALRQRQIAFTCVDEPDLPKLIKPTDLVTSTFAYVRFHGRNKKNWWAGDNKSRYDYLYSDDELLEWLPRLESLAGRVSHLFVFFNNHWKGQAVENARRLKELLSGVT